jgi:hypothetical protein
LQQKVIHMHDETKAQKEKRIADFRAALVGGAKLTEADKKALIGLNFTEFPRVITAHPGHRSSCKLVSLTVAREQFEMSWADLVIILDEFHAFSDAPAFHSPDGQPHLNLIIARLRKELFTFLGLAHSIQDHCRRVQLIWNAPNFSAQLAHYFGSDGLHDFVIKLRRALHHLQVFDTEWQLRWGETGEKTSHINFDKEELLNDHDDWGGGRLWLDAAPDEIDVRSLVSSYRTRHAAFYDWYLSWVATNIPDDVAEYRDIKLQQRRSLARMNWSFLLPEFLKRHVDPMAHLHKYLTADQVAQAVELPLKSQDLADFVITCVDTTGGCTPELREMGYKLFDVPGAKWEAPKPIEFKATLVPT